MTDRSDNKLRRTAIHEAGHAVAHLVIDCDKKGQLNHVSIEPNEESQEASSP